MLESRVCVSAIRVGVLLGGAVLGGCSGSGEDVRIGLCKDLAAGLSKAVPPVTWTETRTEMRRSERLAVYLRFEATDAAVGQSKPMRAVCYYRDNSVDENAFTVSDPMSAYATSPYSVTLNGRAITNPLLAEAIKDAMLKQGRAFLERAQRGLQDITEQVQSRLDDHGRNDQ